MPLLSLIYYFAGLESYPFSPSLLSWTDLAGEWRCFKGSPANLTLGGALSRVFGPLPLEF